MKEYILNIEGKDILMLNPNLIKRQDLNDEECNNILELHRQKYYKLEEMKALDTHSVNELRQLNRQITEIEFKLQDAWRFERNELMHRFWELPHCSCPKMDNREAYGTEYFIKLSDCPLHGE